MRSPERAGEETVRGERLILIVLYAVAFFPMLTNPGIFWDDWTIFNIGSRWVAKQFGSVGIPLFGSFFNGVFAVSKGALAFRFLTFFAYLIAALLLNGILKHVREIDPASRFLLVAFFALFPVNSARIAVVTTPYAICYVLFFFAFWLTAGYLSSRNIAYRLLAIPVFLLSFLTNSLLVFYVIILLYIAYVEWPNLGSPRAFVRRAVAYADFILLPVVFWIVRVSWLSPTGLYARYNAFTSVGLLGLPLSIPTAFVTSFVDVMNGAAGLLLTNLFVVLVGAAILYVVLSERITPTEAGPSDARLLALGGAAFVAAVFPYVAVDKMPTMFNWLSRHQLLVPLGASILLYYGLRLLLTRLGAPPTAQLFVFSVIIAAFVAYNAQTYVSYQTDWFKQGSLIRNFQHSWQMKRGTTFVFEDHTLPLNAAQRTYNFYEYTGLMKYAFGNEKRFGINANDSLALPYYRRFIPQAQYSMRQYRLTAPQYLVTVNYGPFALSETGLVRLYVTRLLDPERYQRNVREILRLTFTKLPAPKSH